MRLEFIEGNQPPPLLGNIEISIGKKITNKG